MFIHLNNLLTLNIEYTSDKVFSIIRTGLLYELRIILCDRSISIKTRKMYNYIETVLECYFTKPNKDSLNSLELFNECSNVNIGFVPAYILSD